MKFTRIKYALDKKVNPRYLTDLILNGEKCKLLQILGKIKVDQNRK